jgi:hypothetical protein
MPHPSNRYPAMMLSIMRLGWPNSYSIGYEAGDSSPASSSGNDVTSPTIATLQAGAGDLRLHNDLIRRGIHMRDRFGLILRDKSFLSCVNSQPPIYENACPSWL